MRAARERQEGVQKHRYAVLKGCRERDIVRPPTPVQITPVTDRYHVLFRALQEIWSGPVKKKSGDDGDDFNTAVGISLPR